MGGPRNGVEVAVRDGYIEERGHMARIWALASKSQAAILAKASSVPTLVNIRPPNSAGRYLNHDFKP